MPLNFLASSSKGRVKNPRAELEVARKEHTDLVEQVKVFEVSDDEFDLVTDGQNPQVQQKLDRIDQLRAEIDIVKVETDEWRCRINRLASEIMVARALLASTEIHLRVAKERAEVQTKNVEELQSRLGSDVSDQKSLAKELKTAKLEVVVIKVEADEMVVQYKVDAEATQDLVKNIVEHMKWQSRMEALEKVHVRGFDLSADIENAKVLEAEAKKLAYPDEEDFEDFEYLGESEGGEDPKGDDAALGKTRPLRPLLDAFVFCFLYYLFVKVIRTL
ncbi:intracellular protein transport protein USO1-like [Nicotiana tomentosiformis]|uniref:intracellular protein transport protein USO1-like n=1 Tax=Nicotiana tomentosiformis TaxID=4098 RepID=UPI00388C6F82